MKATRKKRRTIPYKFTKEHLNYIRACSQNTYNIAEGAVRAGKTIDNVYAFAHELRTTPDKIHLATGSTMANAKLNIGDANGFGLEHIFRGQCRWTKYKDNDALIIKGPATNNKEKIVVFSGGANSNSFKKIRGNSIGLWIATEINIHHDSFIKEAFNRQLAAKNRKIFWDLNPEHPKSKIYTDYIDKYLEKSKRNELPGGYNYQHFTIFENATITPERLKEIISQYDEDSIWYLRDILGQRAIAEGLIYRTLAGRLAKDDPVVYVDPDAIKPAQLIEINIGIDFGGNGSGHAFVATGITAGYKKLIVLKAERYMEGELDPYTNKKLSEIDPDMLAGLFLRFFLQIKEKYGFVTKIYADSAEQVLIRGIRTAMIAAKQGDTKIYNARKSKINGRIQATVILAKQNRLLFTKDACRSLEEAISMAVWNPKKIQLERLDDGSSDIDSLDAFEYSFENDIAKLIKPADITPDVQLME